MPIKYLTDEQLVGRLKGGDNSAFDEIVIRYRAPLCQFASRARGSSGADAEEIVNDVFLKLHRTIQKFDGSQGKLDSWLRTCVSNACRTRFRRLKSRRDHGPLPGEGEEDPGRNGGEWWGGLDAVAVETENARERDTRAGEIRARGLKETAVGRRILHPANWREVLEAFIRRSFKEGSPPRADAITKLNMEIYRRSPPRLDEALRILAHRDTERGLLYLNDAAGRGIQWAEIFAVIMTCADAAIRHRLTRKDAAALAQAIRLLQLHAPHLLSHAVSPEDIEREANSAEAAAGVPWRAGKNTYGPDRVIRELNSFFREIISPDRPVLKAIAAFVNATFPSGKRTTGKSVGEKLSRKRNTL